MSADNGYILRQNKEGLYVIQMYFASADEYPPMDARDAQVFQSFDDALRWYNQCSEYSEYGLSTYVLPEAIRNQGETMCDNETSKDAQEEKEVYLSITFSNVSEGTADELVRTVTKIAKGRSVSFYFGDPHIDDDEDDRD